MRRYRAATLAVLLVTATVACAPQGGASSGSKPSAAGGAGSPTARVRDTPPPPFDRDSFGGSATVDNRWLPLEPGTHYVYKGASGREGERQRHTVVFTVTDLTKVIDGVRTRLIHELDYTDDVLEESELAFFAQDESSNVWHVGEYPEEYEDGKIVKTPAWIQGTAGAKAGIAMPAHPRLGAPDYAQGYAPPPINWADRAKTFRIGMRVCVPASCYDDVLVTEEFGLDQPDAYQTKFYAPGVGVVKVGWRGAKEDEHEVLRLVEATHLHGAQLARERRAALQQEARAYRLSAEVFAGTPRSEIQAQ